MIRTLLTLLFAICAPVVANADVLNAADWKAVKAKAKGETVYWYAWGGEPRINDYITWAGRMVQERYGVTLTHVKIDDTAHAVSRVLAEKAVGKSEGGSVDLIWINGENFAAMKREGLLLSPGWAQELPNWKYVDVAGKPTVLSDFTIPTDGQEAPWGMAQLVFMYDRSHLKTPPLSALDLLKWSEANPGRFSYPQPPNFYGSTFLKQLLAELIADPLVLQKPVDPAQFADQTAPLFTYLDRLHPFLWRSGRAFPQNASAMRQLLADGEVDIAFSNNPADASNAIANNELPDSVRTFVFSSGTIGNTHFVTIPYNANARAGALIVANFLLSPEAQARKQDPDIWGDPTVLDMTSLAKTDRQRFDSLELGMATLSPQELGKTLPEPHPSWVAALESAWLARYGAQ